MGIYLVCEDEREGVYRLHCSKAPSPFEIAWHPKFDEKFCKLEWRRKISKQDAERIISIFNNQSVLLTPRAIWGKDGTTYKLVLSRGHHQVELTWWCHLPQEWAFLQDIPDTLLRIANEAAMLRESEKYYKEAEKKMHQRKKR